VKATTNEPTITTTCPSCGASKIACVSRRFVSPRGCCPTCEHTTQLKPEKEKK
jgi:ssDNA-binding Zn-finger/Zn-ribbon topoisomerase 1